MLRCCPAHSGTKDPNSIQGRMESLEPLESACSTTEIGRCIESSWEASGGDTSVYNTVGNYNTFATIRYEMISSSFARAASHYPILHSAEDGCACPSW